MSKCLVPKPKPTQTKGESFIRSLAQVTKLAKSFLVLSASRCFLRWSPRGGLLFFKQIWELLDIPLILSRVGLGKVRGVPTYFLGFMMLAGFWTRQPSVEAVTRLWNKDALLQWMTLAPFKLSKSTLSRFLNQPDSKWQMFYEAVSEQFCSLPGRELVDGSVIVIDDSKIPHPYGKKNPLLHLLILKQEQDWVWGKNLASALGVRPDGIEFPLSFRYWEKGLKEVSTSEKTRSKKQKGKTKLDLAKEMLMGISTRSKVKKIWVTFDSWYLAHSLCLTWDGIGFLEQKTFRSFGVNVSHASLQGEVALKNGRS